MTAARAGLALRRALKLHRKAEMNFQDFHSTYMYLIEKHICPCRWLLTYLAPSVFHVDHPGMVPFLFGAGASGGRRKAPYGGSVSS